MGLRLIEFEYVVSLKVGEEVSPDVTSDRSLLPVGSLPRMTSRGSIETVSFRSKANTNMTSACDADTSPINTRVAKTKRKKVDQKLNVHKN